MAAKGLRRVLSPTFIGKSRAVASEQKAIWHDVTGAGRRGVVRHFFGIETDEDKAVLRDGLERLIARRIAESGA